MIKFSKHFFILFILVTFIPVGLMIVWSIYTSQRMNKDHINQKIVMESRMAKTLFLNSIERELINVKKDISNLQDLDISLDRYKDILRATELKWIGENLENKNEPVKEVAYFDISKNPNTGKKELVSKFIVLIKNKEYKAALVTKPIPIDKFMLHPPPIIIRIIEGKELKTDAILFTSIKRHGPPGIPPHKRRPPPKPDIELNSIDFPLLNNNKEVVATVQVGFPNEKPFIMTFKHPMLHNVFQNVFILGAIIPVLGLFLSFFAGLYLKKRFLDPIEDLSKVSKSISSGDLSVRVNTNIDQHEIKETLNNFNSMLDGLQEKDQLRDNFITNLTHDFRTPLIAEQRTLEILKDDLEEISEIEEKELIEGLLKNNKHLLGMVDQLLETYKFEAGQLKLNITSVNIQKLIEQCFIQLRPLAIEKNISFESEFSDDIPEFMADYECLKRSFLNIIVNALENIPKGSNIKVTAGIKNTQLEVQVKDNGPGIPEEEIKKLFDRYYSGKRTERKVGSGLGLYICHKFIEVHRGQITVDSVVGEYTNFIISIPLD